MLQLKNIDHIIAGNTLFSKVNWTVNPGKRIALIGPNGAGKTTLLRLLVREIPLQGGEIQHPKDYLIGYLPQEEVSFGRDSVLKESLSASTEIMDLDADISLLHDQLMNDELSSEEQQDLSNRLGILEERFSLLGGYEIEARAKKILTGLGFKESEFSDPISSKSGGWRMRVYLARILLLDPDLLLLDEPTNHLDIESLEWLENYLTEFRGSMIIVSHDRFFIDRLGDEIAEIENGELTHYPGKYSFFEKQKALRIEQLQKKAEEIQAERERLTAFINRFRYKNTKAAQVQDRVKRLEKLETVVLPKSQSRISFKIVSPQKSYKDVCAMQNVSFRYSEKWIFQHVDLQLFRGEKAALVGANGEGKTTLTRLIFNELTPQIGNVSIGERVEIGYYAQHQIDALDLKNTVYSEVESLAAEIYRTKIRDILGIFKLTGEDVDKKISVLSGGEKARVSLAKILLSPVNFLLMDEPTNHLDIQSKEALEKALANYDGTLLLISHDRYFLDKLVTIVYELKDGQLKRFEGNYSDYLRKKSEIKSINLGETAKTKPKTHKDKERKRVEAEARQKISEERNRLKSHIDNIEKSLEDLETEKDKLESLMADPEFYKDQDSSARCGKRYQEIQNEIPHLVSEWEQMQSEFDRLLLELKTS